MTVDARMHFRKPTARLSCFASALFASLCTAQQHPPTAAPDSLLSPHPPAVTIDEPRPFILPTTVDPRPVVPTYPSPPANPPSAAAIRYPQPPVNFRLASAQEAISPLPAKPPLKLAPRSATSRQPVAKPAAPTPGG